MTEPAVGIVSAGMFLPDTRITAEARPVMRSDEKLFESEKGSDQ